MRGHAGGHVPSSSALIEATGLTRGFGGRRAVDRVDVTLAPGETLAVLGPNGAGKSTLLRMLATLLRPDAGELRVAGHACPRHAVRARPRLGYLGHDPLVYLDLTAEQNLELYADLYGVPDPRARIESALRRVGLLARSLDPVRTFSRGMAQRLGLARLMLHRPALLLLDEPHASLDAPGRRLLDGLLAERRYAARGWGGLGDEAGGGEGEDGPGGTVIVTHELDRALALADRVLVLRAGRPVLRRPTAGLDPAAFRSEYERLSG